MSFQGKKLNVRWGRPQQSSFNRDDGPKCTPVPGLPAALPNPGQVIQHDPAKRAKFGQDVKKPLSNPIDLPHMTNQAPRNPNSFHGPDKGGEALGGAVRFFTWLVFKWISDPLSVAIKR